MKAQKIPQFFIIVALMALFLAGCGAPPAVPQTQALEATIIPEPSQAIPQTPAPKATATPIPPKSTVAFAGNLKMGAQLSLGPAEAVVIRLEEAQASPMLENPPKAGMKFILVELKIASLAPGEEFDSKRLFLETSTGKKYSVAGVYGEDSFVGGYEAESGKVSGPVEAFKVFFEVDASESLEKLLLSYQ